MNKIILADDREIFMTGTAQVLGVEDDLRIVARCHDVEELYQAITSYHGAIVIVASSMPTRLVQMIAAVRSAASRLILIVESGEAPYPPLVSELQALVYRSVSSATLLETIRAVGRGERCIHAVQPKKGAGSEDPVGTRVRDRLTQKEMMVVALIIQGCKNREIGLRLGKKEQGVKNQLRSIYDKTGVSDRIELALFTIYHHTLAEAATSAGELMRLSNPGEQHSEANGILNHQPKQRPQMKVASCS